MKRLFLSLLIAVCCLPITPGAAFAADQTVKSTAATVAPNTQAVPVDINLASAEDLLQVRGIGPALAKRIVEYRQKHGPFATVDGLLEVQGIGPTNLESIRGVLKVTPKK